MTENKKQTASVLFLDIDSVLNSFEFGETCYGRSRKPLIEPDVPLASECVSELKRIIDSVPDLKIVWSTDWAVHDDELWHGWKNPRLYLESKKWFRERLIGRTPRKMSSERHDEIIFWLENNIKGYDDCAPGIHVRNFAAVDDIEYGMRLLGRHFFHSEYTSGLTRDMADTIIEFLKTDLEWRSLANDKD